MNLNHNVSLDTDTSSVILDDKIASFGASQITKVAIPQPSGPLSCSIESIEVLSRRSYNDPHTAALASAEFILPQRVLLDNQLDESKMIKVMIDGDDGGVEFSKVYERINAALRIRSLYKKVDERILPEEMIPLPNLVSITQEKGIYQIANSSTTLCAKLRSWEQFAQDANQMRLTVNHSSCIQACNHRLGIMQERSRMFFLLNAEIEERQHLRKAGGVFANVMKVDCSVDLANSMDAQELLDHILSTCERDMEARVRLRDGTNLTLRELFERYGVSDPMKLSVERLGWQPRLNVPDLAEHSVDRESLGAELRHAFMSVGGSLSLRLHKHLLERVQNSREASEFAIPVYGTSPHELVNLAETMKQHGMGPCVCIRWVLSLRFLQSPGSFVPVECSTMQEQLDFFFLPILNASIAPTTPDNASLTWLLQQVGAIQFEGLSEGPEPNFDPFLGVPSSIKYPAAVSSLYYLYYIYSNLAIVNRIRLRAGLNTFQLRCSGAHRGGVDDVIGGYMLGDLITRATKLHNYPVIQYLCGVHGVGLTLSPLSDHINDIVSYRHHPLPNFLHRCLKISIATEAPLRYHHNPNPLIEEYATSQKIFRLSALDMTELAHNSVLISSFPHITKQQWLSKNYKLGAKGNTFEKSQVTNVRLNFREQAWQLERDMMRDLYLNCVRESTEELTRWSLLSNVQEVEYNAVWDSRVRFPRTVLSGLLKKSQAAVIAASRIARALDLRHRYIWKGPNPWEMNPDNRDLEEDFQRKTDTFNEDEWTYAGSDAVFIAFPRNAVHAWPRSLPTLEAFHADLRELQAICASAEVKEFTHKRLENLDHKFSLHLALNHANEAGKTKERASCNRDIYQATKVDTHIHMAAGMTPKQILKFVLKKFHGSSDDIAMKKGDEILTLGQIFAKSGITNSLSVDQLSVQADHTLFERFDNFNNKYNPMDNSDLRSLLLKTDNFMNGRYFAEIIHDVFNQYSRDQYTYAENRVSVYGINIHEWEKLSNWFSTYGLNNKHNKWVIQVPRVYKVFRGQNVIGSFGQYLQNIFQPLWEASLHPSEHPMLHNFLKYVSGFDSVDNEATIDLSFTLTSPWSWTSIENPPYCYYLYYLYANLRTLNEFRASRSFTTFSFRPHCGESGANEHLYGAFLCANSICHGINLRNDPPMQYLYYLAQVGLHVSPLSNNALFLRFVNNPFPDFFRRGLNVSLSTDDPMMFHHTQEPLIEEYSIAARVWGLSPNDLCEIARNSVLQSGFSYDFKREAIGNYWFMSSSISNEPWRTHLSDIRVAFRFETYHTEMQQLEAYCRRPIFRFMLTSDEERDIIAKNLQNDTDEMVILSTRDQAMEMVLREIGDTKDQISSAKRQFSSLHRQERALINNITEFGAQRKKSENELQKIAAQEILKYKRENMSSDSLPPVSAFKTSERLTMERLLKWRPMQAKTLRDVTEKRYLLPHKGRPLPPLQ
ncbi:unnamed protein product [Phytomonas sp. Hart1]|nr:unnamed protein product [Phytomonas sp. Hart1]|eukprot:CCW68969.1 unnamed protein product [Phytomonas sp. isolate Hart1]